MKKIVLIVMVVVAMMFVTGVVKVNVNIEKTQTTTVSASYEENMKPTDVVKPTEAAVSNDGVSEDVKEFFTSFESFVNEYYEFAQNYDPSDFNKSLEEMNYMQSALEFSAKADKYDEGKMSEADATYVKEMKELIETKMAEVTEAIY